MRSHFYLLHIADVSTELAELISAEAFDVGADGVQENLAFEQGGEFYEPTLLENDTTSLRIFFTEHPPQSFMTWLEEKIGAAQVHLSQEVNKDWMEEWKKNFKAFDLVDGIFIVPSWLPVPAEARSAIRIDPGMAFGTGTHETTQLAAKFVAEIRLKARSVLDVGTGTGVLAFLAEHYGAENIVGIEIEDEARRTARENVAHNNSKVKILDGLIEDIAGEFDLVIANIIDGVLIRLQDHLKAKTRAGGHLVLTGILQERDEQFRQRFSFQGFQLVRRDQKAEWIGYLLKKEVQ